MTPPKTDVSTIHLIIRAAVLVAVLCLGVGAVLAWHGQETAAATLFASVTGVATGLLALLAKTSTSDHPTPGSEPTPVEVTNKPDDPVPVAAADPGA